MINIVCFGDSITEGVEFPANSRWTTLLQARLDENSPDTFKVYNRGISGNTTAQGFDRFATDVLPLLPGILIIEFGFNDANVYGHTQLPRVSLQEYERNLREFYRLAIANRSLAVFIVNHLIGDVEDDQGNGISFNDNFAPYHEKVREIAVDVSAHVIDLPAKMRDRRIPVKDFVSEDQIHLSTTANPVYADMVFDGLNEIGFNKLVDDMLV